MKIILNVSQFDDGNLTVEANIFQKPLTSLLTRGRLVSRPCWGLAGRFQNTHKICLRRSKQKTHEHVCSTQISAMKIDWCLTARNISEGPWEWADPGASAGPVPRSQLGGSWQADCWENSEWSYIQACGWLTRQLIYNRFPIIGQGFFFLIFFFFKRGGSYTETYCSVTEAAHCGERALLTAYLRRKR